MKRMVSLALSITAFAILGLVSTPNAHAQGVHCSNATLKGTYSATITGTLGGAPFAELDLVSSTGNGTFSGTGTVSEDGVVSTDVPVAATYTINSNCSGSAVLSSGVTQNFNISPDGSEVDIIATTSGATITAVAKRLKSQNGQ
jgi:hypothetical protein